MIIVAILKHVAGKSADYGAALDYLKYEHDEVLKKPLLDANGNWVLRRDILLEGINCEPELFDVECEMLNAQYHKNQNYNEIKTHHYLISFDPADKDECGLTGERAQAIGMEYVKANFPGHQALVCTHLDGHNGSATMNWAFFCRWSTLLTGWNAMWKLLPRSFTASKRPVNEIPL